jgi:hypothetical protein
MTTDDILRQALYAAGAAADKMHGTDVGDHYRAFADEKYTPEPSLYCDVDGFGLDEDGECERCQRSAAAEAAEDTREDMEYED